MMRSHPHVDPSRIVAYQVAVARKRPQREISRIAMVAEIKHAGKADRSVVIFMPPFGDARMVEKEIDAASDRGMAHLAGRHQSQQGPGRLGWRARPAFGAPFLPVRGSTLAPPPIGILTRNQPGH